MYDNKEMIDIHGGTGAEDIESNYLHCEMNDNDSEVSCKGETIVHMTHSWERLPKHVDVGRDRIKWPVSRTSAVEWLPNDDF